MPIPACLAAGALAVAKPTPATMAAVPVAELRGRGAAVPFTEYEAENGCFAGTLIGPSRALYDIAAEASGRRAVRLETAGQFVEFTLAKPANAVTVRYAVPDSSDGKGRDATLGIYVGAERIGSLQLTSRYSWFYGAYPFTNNPLQGRPHHVFDETRLLLGRVLPAGTKVRIATGAADRSPWYVVDLADFELVRPPLARPAHSVNVTDFGADRIGKVESSGAFRSAIAAARRRRQPLWIPPGTYRLDRHVTVDQVTITGAGPWYSVLRGNGVGLYGRSAHGGSTNVHLSDFAIIGEVGERNDRVKLAAVGGRLGGGSTIQDLWLQHHKSGVWLDGPSDRVTISGLRIVDNSADGINLRRGIRRARIEDVFIRNSGDDGIALWSHHAADANVTIAHNTIVAPTLANGIAIYGGRDIRVADNVVADTLTQGGGMHLGNRFDAVPLSGTISLATNLLLRSGSFDPNWNFGVGALWFYALDRPIDAKIQVSGTELIDSTIEAIQFIGKPIRSVRFSDTVIDGAADWLQVQSAGHASFSNLLARRLERQPYARCHSEFTMATEHAAPGLIRPSDQLCGRLDAKTLGRRLAQ
ncbi:alpha-1,3-glucanase-like protein [Sphingomonas sp. F9_3S_D5_B_2]